MRMRQLSSTVVVVLAASAAFAAGDITVRLSSGGEFDGRITAHDDDGFTLRRTAGGEFRLLWKDLDAESWVIAQRSLTDDGDAPAILALAERAAEAGLRPLAESLRTQAVRADSALTGKTLDLDRKIDGLRLGECEDLVERGKAYLREQNWYQALGRFRDAADLEPDHAWATNGVGEAYFHLRRLKEAREYVEKAIELDPACKDALFNEAYLDLQELDFQGCLEGLDRVLAVPPDEGKLGTREEFAKKVKEAGAGAGSPQEAWERWADPVLIQAGGLRPVIKGIVDGPGWKTEFAYESDHYRVMTDISQDYAELMAARLELIHEEYERQFSYQKTGEKKTRGKKLVHPVLVFEHRKDYVDWFTRVLRDPIGAQTGGVYVSLVKHLVFFKGKTFEDTQLVAWHEAFHQFLDHYIDGAPHWFNEGQAEYFGASVLPEGRKRVRVGQTNAWRMGVLQQLLRQNRLPKTEDLMRRDAAMFMGRVPKQDPRYAGQVRNSPVENYAASWALIHFLIEGQRGRHERLLLNYFKALSDGMSHAESFDKAFAKVKWERFDEAYRAHCEWLLARAVAEKNGAEIPPIPK